MKDYLKDEFREFGYYPIPEKEQKSLDELTTQGLLNELETTIDRETGTILNRDKYELYRREIWNRLSVASTRDITDLVFELHHELDKQLTELRNQFKNHRHDSSKSYSEKPVW